MLLRFKVWHCLKHIRAVLNREPDVIYFSDEMSDALVERVGIDAAHPLDLQLEVDFLLLGEPEARDGRGDN